MKLQKPELTKRQRTHHDGCLPLVGRSQLSGMNASVVVRRLAALSGASAVGAGAYGAHGTDSHIHAAPASFHRCGLQHRSHFDTRLLCVKQHKFDSLDNLASFPTLAPGVYTQF